MHCWSWSISTAAKGFLTVFRGGESRSPVSKWLELEKIDVLVQEELRLSDRHFFSCLRMSEQNDQTQHSGRILIVDDQESHAEATAESLKREGYECEVATEGEEALEKLESGAFHLLITDLVMKPMNGMELMKRVRSALGDFPIIILTGYPTTRSALEAVQEERVTYLRKPVNINDLRQIVENEIEKQQTTPTEAQLQRTAKAELDLGGMIGESDAMLHIFDTIKRVATTDVTVLIQGESGTGKEMVARAIHENSRRSRERFVPLNCAALNEGVLESELFGHEKGAYTGAHRNRKGRFEFADKGTLFLDEIGDMPLETQSKFLRVLEERRVYRLGSNEPVDVDVRLISATNQNLDEMVEEGTFREDLLFRLKVVTIEIPPLRHRPQDIPPLLEHFLDHYVERHNKQIDNVTSEARTKLMSYPWPGNVRELKNCIEGMVVTARGSELGVEDLPPYIRDEDIDPAKHFPLTGISIDEAERYLIENTLEMVDWNRQEAADILEISPRTLARRIKEYGLKD